MLLSVGEVARRCGITVRTLHHYDAIGLLKPLVRSDAGYRCYDRANLERLHRIQALRRSGMSLADIGNLLSGAEVPLADIIERQIAQIDQEVATATRLRQHLVTLQASLAAGQPPDLATWLDTLELMNMYETYFSHDELKHLPLHENPSANAEWAALVKNMKAVMDRGGASSDPEAQQLGLQWLRLLARDTNGTAEFFARLDQMHLTDPAVRKATGITENMRVFVKEAIAEAKFSLYAKYLEPGELAFMREHYVEQMDAWPPLIAAIQREMTSGTPPEGPSMRGLARQWIDHFHSFAGNDPATHARIRLAHTHEPVLGSESMVSAALMDYIQKALASLKN